MADTERDEELDAAERAEQRAYNAYRDAGTEDHDSWTAWRAALANLERTAARFDW